jgi:hypothetical protein
MSKIAEALVYALATLQHAFRTGRERDFDLDVMTLKKMLEGASDAEKEELAGAARRLFEEERKHDGPDERETVERFLAGDRRAPNEPEEDEEEVGWVPLSAFLGTWMEGVFGAEWQNNARRAAPPSKRKRGKAKG